MLLLLQLLMVVVGLGGVGAAAAATGVGISDKKGGEVEGVHTVIVVVVVHCYLWWGVGISNKKAVGVGDILTPCPSSPSMLLPCPLLLLLLLSLLLLCCLHCLHSDICLHHELRTKHLDGPTLGTPETYSCGQPKPTYSGEQILTLAKMLKKV